MSNVDHVKLISDIQKFVLETTFSDKEKINENTFLFRDGYFDSMGFVSLIAFIEEKFGVKVAILNPYF